MSDGGLDVGQELRDHRILVRRIHRIDAADHQDEIHFQIERLERVDEFIDFPAGGSGEKRDLHAGELDRRNLAELLHPGDHLHDALGIAWKPAGLIGQKTADETQVGRNDAELDFGFEDDSLMHG